MKCDRCGFIYNKKVDVCPYCGNIIQKKQTSFLDRVIPLSINSGISVRYIVYIICINFFLLGLVADFGLLTQPSLPLPFFRGFFSLLSYTIGFGVITFIAAFSQSKNHLSSYYKIHFYLLTLFLLALFLVPNSRKDGYFQGMIHILFLAIPIFLIATTLISLAFIIPQKKTLSPFKIIFSGLFNWLISLAIFIVILILKNKTSIIIPSCYYPLVFITFGVISLYFFNVTFFIIARVIAEARRPYGK